MVYYFVTRGVQFQITLSPTPTLFSPVPDIKFDLTSTHSSAIIETWQ